MAFLTKIKAINICRITSEIFPNISAEVNRTLSRSLGLISCYSGVEGKRYFSSYHSSSKSLADIPCYKISPSNVNIVCVNVNVVRHFSVSGVFSKKKKENKVKKTIAGQSLVDEEKEIQDDLLLDHNFEALRKESDVLGWLGSQENQNFDMGVLVIQPWIKWGPQMKQNTTRDLMLDEAAALIGTLPGVRVVKKEVVPLRSIKGKVFFSAGTLERLVSVVRSTTEINAVFISVDLLSNIQVETLQNDFGTRVMDRYSVVLGIFRAHAKSKVAKLQVALAELPYIRKRLNLKGDKERMIMMDREKRLRNALDNIAINRAMIRSRRQEIDIPTIAVVGYTNAGKTSLIRALTGDERAEGKNQLFATLDVTAHGTRLPCGLEVIFIDTVGFIQEIPTDLIASFRATLEDAINADMIIHIRDASHPDYDLQGIIVKETLSSLPVPEKTPVITVANKIDLGTTKSEEYFSDSHVISSTTGQGLEDLMSDIEANILKATGRQCWRFTLPTGSDEIRWLNNAAGILSQEINPDDPQSTTVVAVMTDQELASYKRNFRKTR